MTEKKDNKLYCSFCSKSHYEVKKLIAGPTVFICDECVELCIDIIKIEQTEKEYRERLRKDGYLIIHESKLNPPLVKELKSKDTSLDKFNSMKWS